jgi:hypothetical protein
VDHDDLSRVGGRDLPALLAGFSEVAVEGAAGPGLGYRRGAGAVTSATAAVDITSSSQRMVHPSMRLSPNGRAPNTYREARRDAIGGATRPLTLRRFRRRAGRGSRSSSRRRRRRRPGERAPTPARRARWLDRVAARAPPAPGAPRPTTSQALAASASHSRQRMNVAVRTRHSPSGWRLASPPLPRRC